MTGWDAGLDARLERRVAELWADARPGRDGQALTDALTDAVAGGKRVRPRLVALAHDGLGGRRHDAVLDAAAALELLHTAFVVHDDLIDGDDVRRGGPSVPGRFRADAALDGASPRGTDTYALAGAVLAGDLALGAALLALAGLDVPPATGRRLLALAGEALAVSAAGELADVRLTLGGAWPTVDDVLELAHRKTAAYSFVLPLQTGALLAGADDEVLTLLARAGRSLGIAFQLYDDLAGMFDDARTTGKDPLADLREGKLTLLVSHARGTSAWAELAPRWGDPAVTEHDLRTVRDALEAAGSHEHVAGVAGEHLRDGLADLESAGLGGTTTDWLMTLVGRCAKEAA